MKWKIILLSIASVMGMGLEKSSAIPPRYLLTIDTSNPSAVTVTSTGLSAVVNDSSISGRIGAELLGFFSQDEYSLFNVAPPNSTLTASGLTLSYNNIGSDNYSTGGGENSYLDLGFYVNDASPAANDPQTFSTSQPAFSGSWTIDFASLGIDASALPTAGAQGEILSGFSGQPGTIIGSWQVAAVPEPGTGSLVLLASVIGVVYRRTKKNSNSRA
ncbi:MAG TPA: hypothetical protein VGM62_16335 [Chthoniobacterales bacterium]|jgi:hypothetical protein